MKKLLFLPAALLVLAGCTSPVAATTTAPYESGAPSTDAAPSQSVAPPATGTVACSYTETGDASKPVSTPAGSEVPATGTVDYVMTLNGSPITLTLDRELAPCTVNSFTSLADQGYFDGTVCHRVTDAGIFVLQCGDPSGTGRGGPGYTIPDEFEKIPGYPAGVLAMANTGAPNSGGSQFFIVYADTPLPPQYTVFGTMDDAGVAQVAEIAAGGNDGSFGNAGGGVPNLPAEISSIAAA
ncbi:peptidylprolyl isomerase [Micropruina sp.]|uniref:peptidylprolyl isomerase n=1 Tax=Micropruina sp. TaxID=2737536 RepID=UPI002619D582|nr:peptidylprolyl isomerase [Micropruina sp.]